MTTRASAVPVNGTLVTDAETGETGMLMAVATVKLPYGSCREAYLRPVGGGVEWTTRLESIRPADRHADA